MAKKYWKNSKEKTNATNFLISSIDNLITAIEANDFHTQSEIIKIRPDADCVHSDGFYFFNINIHRTLILIAFDDGEATIVWGGSHDEYEKTFRNNKNTIKKWLRDKEWIK